MLNGVLSIDEYIRRMKEVSYMNPAASAVLGLRCDREERPCQVRKSSRHCVDTVKGISICTVPHALTQCENDTHV